MQAVYYLHGVRCSELNADLNDRALSYGDGFFETMLLRLTSQGVVFPMLKYHRQRLQQSGRILGLDVSLLESELTQAALDFYRNAKSGDYVCKLHVCREAGARGYYGASGKPVSRICITAKPESNDSSQALTLCRHPLSRNPALAGIKHLNRLDQVVARNEWQDEFYDGVMLNIQGRPVECTAHNLFWVKDGQIYTADLSQEGVDGVVRRWLLSQFEVMIGCYPLETLLQADEVFITNALKGIVSVHAIGDKIFGAGKVASHVKQQYQSWIDSIPVLADKG